MAKKARVKFCWECGRKLWASTIFSEVVVDGHKRILHKACAKARGLK